jgi:hypothetical protein
VQEKRVETKKEEVGALYFQNVQENLIFSRGESKTATGFDPPK